MRTCIWFATFFIFVMIESSCGVMMKGISKLTIKSNTDSANVFIDSKFVGKTPLVVQKIDDKKAKSIRIEKEGYRTHGDVTIEKEMTYAPYVMDIVFGAITAAVVGLAIVGPVGLIGASAGMLIPGMLPMGIIDLSSGGLIKLTKTEYNISIDKIPPAVDTKLCRKISCTDFNIKINPGEKIGEMILNKTNREALTWNQTNNLSAGDFTVLVNNELNKLGYNIIGLGANKNKNFTADIRIEAEITQINLTIYKTQFSGLVNQYGTVLREPVNTIDKAEGTLPVKWRVISNKDETVLYERDSSIIVSRYLTNDLNVVFYDAITVSLYDLISKPEFAKIIMVEASGEAPVSFSDVIHIKKPAANAGKKVTDILKVCKEGVVTIETDYGTGSGFLISEDGYIITNNHVIEKSKMVNVMFSNGFTLIGEVVRIIESYDLALIKVKGSGFKPIVINISESEVGSEVYAIGAPLGKQLQQSVTKGIVSGQRVIENKMYIQTDVGINMGNSGGPLINKDGEVIGVVQAKVIGKGVEGIGFCIPAKDIFEKLNISYNLY